MEVLREVERGEVRCALFDFDGTISLVREGWQGVMIPMMVEILSETPKAESEKEIKAIVTEFVERLTGKQTIYQMIRLAEEVEKRGGKPLDPLEYKRIYHERLSEKIRSRLEGLRSGRIDPEEMRVPGSLEMLEALKERGVVMYLASGTDLPYVLEEAKLIGVDKFFDGRIYGALDQWWDFSKGKLIQQIIEENGLKDNQFVAFGDGFVEIEEAKKVGGIAVGVASDEVRREGINEWKRRRLMEAGADVIVPDFRGHEKLVRYLMAEEK
ncbi:MAG: HAD family hydrolase [Candidatus Latescibacterota bacterium]|nr:MAG: HAD family hydrolase [Candidatus Latescibacterota bacterium]